MTAAPDRRTRRRDAAILLGLLALPLALFGDALLGGRVFYERDIHAFWLPKVESFVRVVGAGSWPVWDPYFGFGQPLLADPGSQVFYPFTWLNLVLFPPTVYAVIVVAHVWLAAAGAYVLARSWGISPLGAAVGATTFAASGPLLSTVTVYHHFMGAAWMPWVLAALEAVLARPGRRTAAALALAAGVQVLAGSGDMVVLTALAGLIRMAAGWTTRRDRRPRPAALAWLAAAGALALALSAAQWIPTVELVRASARASMPADANLYWSVHPLAIVEMLLPRPLAALPLSESARATLFESREPFFPSLYLGLVGALLLVPSAAARDRRRSLTAAAGAVFFLLAALGRHTPVLPLLIELPAISWFRYPVKYTVGLALMWALLAGLGLDGWRERDRPRRARWALVALAAAAFLAALVCAAWLHAHARELGAWVDAPPDWRPSAYAPLVFALRRAAGLAAIAALLAVWRARRDGPPLAALVATAIVLDIVTAGRGVNDLAPRELLASRPPVLGAFAGPPDAHRVYATPESMAWLNRALVRGPAGWKPEWSWALGLQESLSPPLAARWGIRGSYEADYTGLAPARSSTLAALVGRYHESALGLRLLRMAGVTEVVGVGRLLTPGLEPVAETPTVFTEPVHVARVPAPLPRAYRVTRARTASGDDALRALGDPAFDPERTVLLEEPAAERPPAAGGEARIVRARPDEWRVETVGTQEAYVVVLDADAPGWTATVDGRPAPIQRANLAFRAVAVPAGAHTIVMRYRPRSVVVGLALSAVAAATLALAFAGRRPPSIEAPALAGLTSPTPHG